MNMINVSNLGKAYHIGNTNAESYAALRDVISNTVRSAFKKKPSPKEKEDAMFWALRDINFDIQKGERIGVIGRNGAGKSTLLKLLSRITEPTKGRIEVNGRVASLLEVGTGFHAELTGRENIFLNGAIIGMSRQEIKRKFDEIVAFSEVEQFLDVPVKRYSSGMYMKLAFSVAAHLEPEILIIDEVLAVGDLEFQKKSIGKMEDVSKNEGRTILFVSHQMEAINSLTSKCIFLKDGQLVSFEKTEDAIKRYLYQESEALKYIHENPYIKEGIIEVELEHETNVIDWGSSMQLNFYLKTDKKPDKYHFSFQVFTSRGVAVLHLYPENFMLNWDMPEIKEGVFKFSCVIPKLRLHQGDYFITCWLTDADSRYLVQSLDKILGFTVSMEKIPKLFYPRKSDECVYIEDCYFK